jgi:hypothetical protein
MIASGLPFLGIRPVAVGDELDAAAGVDEDAGVEEDETQLGDRVAMWSHTASRQIPRRGPLTGQNSLLT